MSVSKNKKKKRGFRLLKSILGDQKIVFELFDCIIMILNVIISFASKSGFVKTLCMIIALIFVLKTMIKMKKMICLKE